MTLFIKKELDKDNFEEIDQNALNSLIRGKEDTWLMFMITEKSISSNDKDFYFMQKVDSMGWNFLNKVKKNKTIYVSNLYEFPDTYFLNLQNYLYPFLDINSSIKYGDHWNPNCLKLTDKEKNIWISKNKIKYAFDNKSHEYLIENHTYLVLTHSNKGLIPVYDLNLKSVKDGMQWLRDF